MRHALLVAVGLLGRAFAHGDHSDSGSSSQQPLVGENADWMTKHMAGMSRDHPFFFFVFFLL